MSVIRRVLDRIRGGRRLTYAEIEWVVMLRLANRELAVGGVA